MNNRRNQKPKKKNPGRGRTFVIALSPRYSLVFYRFTSFYFLHLLLLDVIVRLFVFCLLFRTVALVRQRLVRCAATSVDRAHEHEPDECAPQKLRCIKNTNEKMETRRLTSCHERGLTGWHAALKIDNIRMDVVAEMVKQPHQAC